jgi:hypothetical protein
MTGSQREIEVSPKDRKTRSASLLEFPAAQVQKLSVHILDLADLFDQRQDAPVPGGYISLSGAESSVGDAPHKMVLRSIRN